MGDGAIPVKDRLCPACDTYRWPHEFGGRARGLICLPCKETRKRQRVAAHCAELMRTLPQTQGRRRLIGVEHEWGGHYVAVVECSCSFVSKPPVFIWKRGFTKCGKGLGELCKSCAGLARVHSEQQARLAPEPLAEPTYMARLVGSWAHLPTERDPYYNAFIEAFARPATLQEVAEFYGLSRERIRQIEEKALAKLKERDRDGTLRSLLEERVAGPTGMRNCPLDWDELPTFTQGPGEESCQTQEPETDS